MIISKQLLAGALIGIVATLSAAQVQAGMASLEAGDWLARGRLIHVDPNEEYDEVSGIAGTKAGVDDPYVPEVDFTYMLTPNWGLELILGTSPHNVDGIKGAVEHIGVTEVWVLPPTLTLQYHFDHFNSVRPYVGLGVNYTHFYHSDEHDDLKNNFGANSKVEFEDSWGLAAQVGADIYFKKDWFINLDLKYIDMDTEMTISNSAAAGDTDVELDPLVFGLGIGMRF